MTTEAMRFCTICPDSNPPPTHKKNPLAWNWYGWCCQVLACEASQPYVCPFVFGPPLLGMDLRADSRLCPVALHTFLNRVQHFISVRLQESCFFLRRLILCCMLCRPPFPKQGTDRTPHLSPLSSVQNPEVLKTRTKCCCNSQSCQAGFFPCISPCLLQSFGWILPWRLGHAHWSPSPIPWWMAQSWQHHWATFLLGQVHACTLFANVPCDIAISSHKLNSRRGWKHGRWEHQ